jgi:hypothetical protein
MQIYFRRKTKNTIISKIKTEQHHETYDVPSFMANPAAQMVKNFGKLVCASMFFYFHHFKQFFRLYNIKSSYIVLGIKNQSDSKRKHPPL